ncbi:hypothetical protein BDD12DRAFT_836418 [Trichophaea hybrida]|nr:hypothetical protein BDD12DRAFT_836418 [Trichophaea hybrida]
MSETHLQQTQTPHHSSHQHSHNHNNLSSPIHRTGSTSSITAADSKANNGDGGGDNTSRHHKPKQFVVSRHGHNPRVPSFGRGLNKLGNKQPPQHATPPKREGSGRTSARKGGVTFELGSPTGSTTDGGNSYKGEPEPEVPPPIARTGSNNRLSRTDSNNNRLARTDSNNNRLARTDSNNNRLARTNSNSRLARTDSHNGNLPHNTSVIGLQKSSSTRSLEHESRKHRAMRRGTTSTTDKATADRARSKSGDRKRQQQQQQQQTEQAILHKQQQQRRAQSPDELTEMMARVAMVPVAPPPSTPPQSQQQHPTSVATAIATPPSFHNPITPAHSLPSQEPLTSRFIHASPSSGADSAPNRRGPPTLTRSESTYSITSAAPSRTQQKLWLQRAAVDAKPSHIPPTTMTPHPIHGRDYFVLQAARAEKEYDRVAREYLNVRRFKNPLGEAVDRVREMQARRGVAMKQQRPTTGDAAAIAGGKLGLSRSLQEGDARRGGATAGRIGNANVMRRGSRDDLGVDGRSGEVEAALDRLWRMEMLVSTNND